MAKGGQCVRLTTSPPSCADCHEIWESQPPGTLKNFPGLYRNCFTVYECICFTNRYGEKIEKEELWIAHSSHFPNNIALAHEWKLLLRNQGPELMPRMHRSLKAYCATLLTPLVFKTFPLSPPRRERSKQLNLELMGENINR